MRTTKIIITFALSVTLIAVGWVPFAGAQDRAAPAKMSESFTYIPGADLDILMGPTRGDRAARVVDIGRGAQLGAFILHYEPMSNEPNSFYHSEINEVYYVIRGEGTALLGGQLADPTWADSNTISFSAITGPTARGSMTDYTTVDWGPGDVIMVPAGVPHMIGWQVREANDILRVVFDPNGRLNRISTRAESLAQDRARQQVQGETAETPPALAAPANMPGTFTFIPSADLEALMTGNRTSDTPARIVDAGNDSQLGVYVLHMAPRQAPPGDVNSFYHAEISELYYIVRGAGTVLLGGELENATWDDSDSRSIRTVRGPSVNGIFRNAEQQPFAAGDIIIVSAGVPHSFTYNVAEETDIVRIVVDPNKVLEPK